MTIQQTLFMVTSAATGSSGQSEITTPGTSSWTVPAGVTSISMVAVQQGATNATATTVTVSGTIVCQALNGDRIGDGGGDGGLGGFASGGSSTPQGGGGAGGYSGDGGRGGDTGDFPSSPTAGAGGGGGAGGNNGHGGGVGLKGQGTSGAAGAVNQGGFGGSGGANGGNSGATTGGAYGGGGYGTGVTNSRGNRGGALSYKNNVSVTPGQTITIDISNVGGSMPGPGAVRIIWGPGRSYPSNAADV